MHQLKNWCELYDKTSPRREFWELLKDNDVSIITKQDTNDADVQNLTSEDAVKVSKRRRENIELNHL